MDIQKQLYKGIRYSRPVTQLFKWQILILIIGKQPHKFFSKFTDSDRCELFGKSLQRKPRHHQECACFSGKVSCITDRSPPNVHRLYQMAVRYVMCSFRELLRWNPRYSWESTLISANTAFDYWQIARSPDHQSVCGATYELKAWITKQ